MASNITYLILVILLALPNPAAAQESSVDPIISDLYESISFDETRDPDYETFKTLFVEEARLISVKDTTSYTLSPDDYEQSMSRQRESGNIIVFEEKELYCKTEQYGKILHVFSTYQTHLETSAGIDSARGINSIQLMKKDGDWKVTSLIWYEEDDKHPLPAKYLPPAKN
jgi:hypothetical protein